MARHHPQDSRIVFFHFVIRQGVPLGLYIYIYIFITLEPKFVSNHIHKEESGFISIQKDKIALTYKINIKKVFEVINDSKHKIHHFYISL